jgi:hypothetical protein
MRCLLKTTPYRVTWARYRPTGIASVGTWVVNRGFQSIMSSTFLLPFAPPRFAARLPRYYESSDFCRAASSDVASIAKFVPGRRAVLRRRAWAIGRAVSLAAGGNGSSSASCTRQISLLISFDLPTIPPPTTTLPFRHGRFGTLLHRRDLPRLSPGQTLWAGGIAVARSRVRALLGASPTGLAESSSHTLLTGCSSQVALHPSSRKRSYRYRLQAGNVSLRGTSTLQIKRLHRRTSCRRQTAGIHALASVATDNI